VAWLTQRVVLLSTRCQSCRVPEQRGLVCRQQVADASRSLVDRYPVHDAINEVQVQAGVRLTRRKAAAVNVDDAVLVGEIRSFGCVTAVLERYGGRLWNCGAVTGRTEDAWMTALGRDGGTILGRQLTDKVVTATSCLMAVL